MRLPTHRILLWHQPCVASGVFTPQLSRTPCLWAWSPLSEKVRPCQARPELCCFFTTKIKFALRKSHALPICVFAMLQTLKSQRAVTAMSTPALSHLPPLFDAPLLRYCTILGVGGMRASVGPESVSFPLCARQIDGCAVFFVCCAGCGAVHPRCARVLFLRVSCWRPAP